MKTGFQIALTVALVSASAAACGPTPDPSKNNDNVTPNSVTPNNTTSNNPMNNTTSNNPMNNTTSNNNMNNTTSNNPMNNTNNMTTPTECVVNDVFFGQIDSESDEHAGGAPSTDPIATDAGLGAAMTEFANIEGGSTATVDLPVAGAIVTATNYSNGGNVNFWVEDANAAFEVRLGFDGCSDGACVANPIEGGGTIKVGDEVNFTITELENYFDNAQIIAVSDFTVESSGNPVPYTDLSGQPIDVAAYKGRLVRVGGRLSETSEGCGPADCFDLMHGDQVAQYRIDAEPSRTFGGDCVTYFGPLSEFQGTPSLDVENFSWRSTQF